ncbi:ABC-2 type transport system ATP-binding protein [Anaerosphaera aminiphila DSM 21120]|uniref:ABC-2 type transport system ATP-binding protein n=1 Tax=Anaerosphaera aminiphila DSM 21120 TaxID=1120995 RepID=A0A1M5V3D0_9FIRM|nr:ABC transporter ATP-binding protein [Anaerosphaera aminiphila]SHH69741.1 ABC-2 type transport system ATP-binding protein [Anaerosphaera aminiphila DSM 21120]
MEHRNVIEIKGLAKSFGKEDLYKDFNLNIKKGDVHGLIGPNGSGKTTLLRLITSLYQLDSGSIKMDLKHSMLLENDYLYEEFSGRKNIELFGQYFGYEGKKENYKRYSDLLELTEHLDKKVSNYSKGMKRKLSLLIVVMIGADIILLDEPTSGVDPISRVEIRSLVSELKKEGKTIIITSHDLSEIEKIASRVTMIKSGNLIFDKDVNEFNGQTLEDLFLEVGKNEKKL